MYRKARGKRGTNKRLKFAIAGVGIAIIGLLAVYLLFGNQATPGVQVREQEGNEEGGILQVASVLELIEASGLVDGLTIDGWVVSGEWTLRCSVPCYDTDIADIQFEMRTDMVRTNGANSHSHSYSRFSPASVLAVDEDSLIIEGTIFGSGPVGTNQITIKLNEVSSIGALLFELPGNSHLRGEIRGIIVQSRG